MCYRQPRGRRKAFFFIILQEAIINIFVYSDESGVLDKVHNDFYVFGGLVFLSRETRDNYSRIYAAAENNILLLIR